MRQRYRLYRRNNGGRYYLHDGVTGKQESLHTSDRARALRLLHARKEAEEQPAINLQIAKACLNVRMASSSKYQPPLSGSTTGDTSPCRK